MTLTQINKAGLDELALDHVFTIGASGSSAYTFQGEGLNGTVNNPTLYLTRGKTYRFENGSGGHPIRIQSTSGASGTAYNTGVTNNAGNGTVIVEVQHDAPDVLYYQCTSHASMNGILYITGALADGGVTTAKIANDAVTAAKIAANAVGQSEIASGAVTGNELAAGSVTASKIGANEVTTAKIADNAVTHAKYQDIPTSRLLGRTSSGTGDPETLDASTVRTLLNVADGATNSPTTTINNNSNNRVITGSGTANTLEGEANLTFDGDALQIHHATDPEVHLNINTHGDVGKILGDADGLHLTGNGSSNQIRLKTNNTERLRVQSNGDVYLNPLQGSTGVTSGAIRRFNAGLDYWNGTAGSANAIKYAAHGQSDDNMYGMGISGSLLELQSQVDIGFFAGSAGGGTGRRVERARIRAGGGITFNGDTAAANALDDYEEGTWTPQAASGVSGYIFSNNAGYYRKIGDLVWWFLHTTTSLVPNDNQVYEIHGLPYTSAATNHNYGWNANIVYTANSNHTTIANMRPLVQRAASYIYFHTVGLGSSQRVFNSTFRNGMQGQTMILAGNYQAG